MITGTHEHSDGRDLLVLNRTFDAPIEDVWAVVTESERLGRWFCTWADDPKTGQVQVTWAFEEGAPTEPYIIEVCEEPTRLRVRSVPEDPAQAWILEVRLSEAADGTTLRFSQVLDEVQLVTDVGPGWEYYLDRLEESVRTEETATTTWEGFQRLGPEYAAAFGLASGEVRR